MRPSSSGFTLIEVLVVLIIITVLAGVVSVSLFRKPGEARVAAARMQIKQLATAVKLYHAEQRRFPTQAQGLEALVRKPEVEPIPRNYPGEGYLDSVELPLDSWGNEYVYLVPGRRDELFEIISYGADAEPGGEGEDADISSSGR